MPAEPLDHSLKQKPLELLRYRDYLLIFLSKLQTMFGTSLTTLTLLLYINYETGSISLVAALAVTRAVPRIVFSFHAGLVADHVDRKRVMRFSDIVNALCVAALIPAIISGNVPAIFALAFVQSTVDTYFYPASAGVTVRTVPRASLMAAYSLLETGVMFASVAGTTVAGLMLSFQIAYWVPLSLDAFTFLVSFVLVGLLKVETKPEIEEEEGNVGLSGYVKKASKGVSVIASNRVLVGAVSSAAVVMLGLGAFNVLYVPFLSNEVGIQPHMYGPAELMEALASAVAGVILISVGTKLSPNVYVIAGLITLGITTVLISQAEAVWFLFTMLFIFGLAPLPVNASLSTIIQSTITDSVRGRVSAAFNGLVSITDVCSMLLAGLLLRLIGSRDILLGAGVVVILGGILALFLLRSDGKATHGLEHAKDEVLVK